ALCGVCGLSSARLGGSEDTSDRIPSPRVRRSGYCMARDICDKLLASPRFAKPGLMCVEILPMLPTHFLSLCRLLLPAARPEPALSRYTFAEPHMGTQFQVIGYAADEATAGRAAKAAFARAAELDGIMSDYKPASELMRLCQKAGGDPVPISAELFFVL